MKKFFLMSVITVLAIFLGGIIANAHFGGVIPSVNIVTENDPKTIRVDLKFFHPMENEYMDMEKPVEFGVMHMGEKEDLLKTLTGNSIGGRKCWQAGYTIKRPGDYTFYVVPKPYWEPAEDCFIVHYTKACVNALGLEQGWDAELGFETEIIPLTRPYGLWTGNVFSGIVKLKGEPVPYAEIEVEYYNVDGKIKSPSDPYVTQAIKADSKGVFSYAMPKAGWWAFAALSEASWTLKDTLGKDKPVEIGAVYWVKTIDME
ncbi:MAG: DUF4198 domain-containing protein [Candidatus Omnitrophica bacterium]|nr:DUF4198 domain-containing protein [Candidatus Omnitrophota bacterium]